MGKFRGIALSVAFTAAVCAAPAQAQGGESKPAAPDYSQYSDEQLSAMAGHISPNEPGKVCDNPAPILAELARRHPGEDKYEKPASFTGLICAVSESRSADGLAYVAKLEKYEKTPLVSYYALWLLTAGQDGPGSLARLREIFADGFTSRVDPFTFASAMRVIGHAGLADELNQLVLDYSDTPAFATIDPRSQEAFAAGALDAAAAAGKDAQAVSLLAFIRDPSAYRHLLAQRKYEAIWPQLEQRVGDHYRSITLAYVEWTKAQYEAEPTNRDKFGDYANALLFDGRFEDVVTLVHELPSGAQSFDAVQEGDAWAAFAEVHALDALDRDKQADALFDQLAAVSPEHYWAATFIVNRGTRLISHGRWEDGIAAVDYAAKVVPHGGSPYVTVETAAARACALQRLGRLAEARKDLAFVVEHSDKDPAYAATALLCMNDEPAAVDLLLAKLADPKTRAGALDALDASAFDLYRPRSKLPDPHDLIERHPELREAVLKYARFTPERFYLADAAKPSAAH